MADKRPNARNRPAGQMLGTYACWSCKREVPIKRLPSGKLSAACPWCDFPHYANGGTEHEQNLLGDPSFKHATASIAVLEDAAEIGRAHV